jgi:hypothetical protein
MLFLTKLFVANLLVLAERNDINFRMYWVDEGYTAHRGLIIGSSQAPPRG